MPIVLTSPACGGGRRAERGGWGKSLPKACRRLCGDTPTLPSPASGRGSAVAQGSADRHAAADGAVQHLRGLLDPLGGGVERIGHRTLCRPGAIRRYHADIAQRCKLLFEAADALLGLQQLVTN